MHKIKSTALVIISVFVVTLGFRPAHATLSSMDDVIFGVGSITLDDVNNLEWLDISLSAGLSFNAVAGEFGAGGNFEGFRFATAADLQLLAAEAGATVNTIAPANDPVVASLQSLLGITDPDPPFTDKTRAFYDDAADGPDITRAGSFQLTRFFLGTNTGSAEFLIAPDIITKAGTAPLIGAALIRSSTGSSSTEIPEPGTLTLIGVGLLGLGFTRRRRKTA